MASDHNESIEISKNKLLQGLNDNALFQVCAQGKNSFFEPGQALFKKGDSNETLFLITSGSIKLIQNQNGQEKDIAVLQAGDGSSSRILQERYLL